jgi:glycine/D-amino acid oxidase-like deaminating enzyme
MGQGPRITRRTLLFAAPSLASCGRDRVREWPVAWIGADPTRGHRLRAVASRPTADGALRRRADVVVVGAGVAGLAAARALGRRGVDAVHLLELEDQPGGTSRGHAVGNPLPLGIIPAAAGAAGRQCRLLLSWGTAPCDGRAVADKGICSRSPGGCSSMGSGSQVSAAGINRIGRMGHRRFAADVRTAWRARIRDTDRARGVDAPAHEALDRITFAHWLDKRGLGDRGAPVPGSPAATVLLAQALSAGPGCTVSPVATASRSPVARPATRRGSLPEAAPGWSATAPVYRRAAAWAASASRRRVRRSDSVLGTDVGPRGH